MLIVKENEIEARALFHICSYMLDQLRGVSECVLPLETVESQEFLDMLSGCSDGCVSVVCFQSCVLFKPYVCLHVFSEQAQVQI